MRGIFRLPINMNNSCQLRGDVFSPLSFMYDPDLRDQRFASIMEGLISFFSVLQFLSGIQLCSDIIQQGRVPNEKSVGPVFAFGYLYAILWVRHASVAFDYVGVIVYAFGALLFVGYNFTLYAHEDSSHWYKQGIQYPGRIILLMICSLFLMFLESWILVLHYIIVTMFYMSPAIFMYHCKRSGAMMAVPFPMMFLNLIVAILKFGRGIILSNIMVSYVWAIILSVLSVRVYHKYETEKMEGRKEKDLMRENASAYTVAKLFQGF